MSLLRRSLLAALFLAGSAIVWPESPVYALGSLSDSEEEQSDDFATAVDHVDDEEYAEAIPLLEKVVAAEPDNADAFNYLGYSYRKTGVTDKALANYLMALELEPEHLGANEYLGELYLEMKDLAKAEERLAVLEEACGDCEEYEELAEKIEAYKASQS